MVCKWTHSRRDKELVSKQSESKVNPVGKAKKVSDKLADLIKIYELKYTYQIQNGTTVLYNIQNFKPLTEIAKTGFLCSETHAIHLCKADTKAVPHHPVAVFK